MPRISSPTVWTGSSAASAGTTAGAAAAGATTGAATTATGSALATAFLTGFLASTAGAGAATAIGAGTTATSTSFLATRFVATLATAGVEFIVLVPVEELEDILRTSIFFMSCLAQIFIFAFTFLLKFPFEIKKHSFFFEVD